MGSALVNNGRRAMRFAWQVIIFVVGMSVLLAGVVMIFTPGPAFVFIPLGLAILATEFHWAHRAQEQVKARLRRKHTVIDRSADNATPPATRDGDQ
jgi:uncharacterized protein (TIGR02611 family)